MGDLKKKLNKEARCPKATVDAEVKQERVVFKNVSEIERQRLRIGVYPYLM